MEKSLTLTSDLDAKRKALIVEARAKIIWGESSDQVREWLVAKGFTNAQSDEILRQTLSERAREVRRRGTREILTGAFAVALASAIFVSLYPAGFFRRRVLLLACLVLAYGVWHLLKGVGKVLDGEKARGSVAEM